MRWTAVSFDDAARDRIKDAATFEKRIRLESFLGVKQNVLGFELRHLTPRDILHLEFTENRIVVGGDPELEDYVHLVLLLSEEIKFFKKRKITKIAKIIKDSDIVKEEILSFYYSSLNDLPSLGSSSAKEEDEYDSSVSVCSLVDSLSSAYGWTLDEILDTPLSTCLQLLQRVLKRNLGDKYQIRNGITQQAKANELNRIKSNG